jgi:hypothetical protein
MTDDFLPPGAKRQLWQKLWQIDVDVIARKEKALAQLAAQLEEVAAAIPPTLRCTCRVFILPHFLDRPFASPGGRLSRSGSEGLDLRKTACGVPSLVLILCRPRLSTRASAAITKLSGSSTNS